jgi:FMN phosphatase YigB (HAD superfamily)
VGGVAIFDFSGTEKLNDVRDELGVKAEQQAEYAMLWAQYDPLLCTTLAIHELQHILNESLGLELAEDYSLLQAFVTRFEPNPAIWEAVEYARQKAGVGLLTNMYTDMFDAIVDRGILPPVKWDAVVDSSIEKLEKPNKEFFRIAEKRAGVKGEEILFIDNTQGHLDAAKKLGWQTFLYNPADAENSSSKLLKYLKNAL